MKRILAVLAVVVLVSSPAVAGPNSNGAIIVHTNDTYGYLSATVCTTTLGRPASCQEAITRTDKPSGAVVWLLASFLPTANPIVATIYFGLYLDAANLDPSSRYGICGPAGSLELPDAGWPNDAVGNTVGFGTPVAGMTLFPFYFFQVDEVSGLPGPYLCSGVNPLGGYAAFFDNTFPPAQDDIAQFGCVRWYQEGDNTCPEPQVTGACCDADLGLCTLTAELSCQPPRNWHPEWTSCVPNPCPGAPGACCDPATGACTTVPLADCPPPMTWIQDWLDCRPNPCPGTLGVCCDLSTGACSMTTYPDCPPPMFWDGRWTSCLPNPCPQPVAACCMPDGACTLTAHEDCLYPGAWYGEWVSCSPNPCPQPIPGPNNDGAIIVHTNDSYGYYSTTVCTTDLGQPATCQDAITRTDKASGAVIWFLAAFLPTANPAVAGVSFGISLDEASLDASTRFGVCGPPGTVEAPSAGWPANDAANTVFFGSSMMGNTLFRFYYFEVDEFSGSAGPFLCSATNPVVGQAEFYADGFPPLIESIERFGCVRWYDTGYNQCPSSDPSGACCFLDGHCEVLSESQCLVAPEHAGWLGPGTMCQPPDPCVVASAACCAPDGSCTVTTQEQCQAPDIWYPDSPGCVPNPCPAPVRTEKTTWGRIKADYR